MSRASADSRSIDRRSAVELVVGFVVGSVLFSALSIDTVQKLSDDPGYTRMTLQLGLLIGTLIGLGLTLLAVRAERRGSGRRSQRLGRRAWRAGRLPAVESDRASAIADLQRRRRAMENGLSPQVMIGIWALLGVLQVATSESVLHTTIWILFSGAMIGIGVRGVLDRRRLPRLEALLDRSEEHAGIDDAND
jgi:hypothetical protein